MRKSWGEMEFREGILGTKNIQKYFSEMKNGKGREGVKRVENI